MIQGLEKGKQFLLQSHTALCLNKGARAVAWQAVGSESHQANQCRPNDFGELHRFKLTVAVIHQITQQNEKTHFSSIFVIAVKAPPVL